MDKVGEGITTVAVGLTGVVGDATTVKVFVGTSSVFVGIEVCNGSMLTLNCPQAVRANIVKRKNTLCTLIRSPF
jgi:hypothetical protein